MDLWYSRCPLPSASGVAIELGLLEQAFEPLGIRVRSLDASADVGVRQAHFDHGQRGLFREGGMIPPIWSRSRGADTALVGTAWIDEYQAVIALPGSGIARPEDLRGRRVGVPRRPGEAIDYWRAMCLRGLESALTVAGLPRDAVQWVDLPIDAPQIHAGGTSARGNLFRGAARARRQSREALALVRGEVDAIYTASAPGAQLTAFLGADVVVDLGAHPDPAIRGNNQVPIVLTADGALVRDEPMIVARYLACLLQAAAAAERDPARTRAIAGGDLGATPEWVEAANGPELHRRLRPVLTPENLAGVARQKDFLLAHGFIASDIDMAAWVDPRPLALAEALAAGGRPALQSVASPSTGSRSDG